MEFFGDDALIFTKLFQGRPMLFRGRPIIFSGTTIFLTKTHFRGKCNFS